MRKYISIVVFTIICLSTSINAQNSDFNTNGQLCEGYILKKIANDKAISSRIVNLKSFNTDKTPSREFEKWFSTIHKDMLATFELQHKKEKVLIFRANVAGATGIAANFANWHIQFKNQSLTFRSLSENPKLIYLDKKGMLNYYSIDYGKTFLDKGRDWNNVTLDLTLYRINPNGESQLVKRELGIRCK